jgi:hypothetical protein
LVREGERQRTVALAGDGLRHGPREDAAGDRDVDPDLSLAGAHARAADEHDRGRSVGALGVRPVGLHPAFVVLLAPELTREAHERALGQLGAEALLLEALVVDVGVTWLAHELVGERGEEVREATGGVARLVELFLRRQELVDTARFDEHALGLAEPEVREPEAGVGHDPLVALADVALLGLVESEREEALADRLDPERGALLDVLDRVDGLVEALARGLEVPAGQGRRATLRPAQESGADPPRVGELGLGPREIACLEVPERHRHFVVVRGARREPHEG